MPEIQSVTYTKERKVGLPNYSNVSVGLSMVVTWKSDEQIQHQFAWDQLDAELDTQLELEKSRFAIFSAEVTPKPIVPAEQPQAPTPPVEKPVQKTALKQSTQIFKPGT